MWFEPFLYVIYSIVYMFSLDNIWLDAKKIKWIYKYFKYPNKIS